MRDEGATDMAACTYRRPTYSKERENRLTVQYTRGQGSSVRLRV